MFVTLITIAISSLLKFDHYRDTRAFILDPCIQGILKLILIKLDIWPNKIETRKDRKINKRNFNLPISVADMLSELTESESKSSFFTKSLMGNSDSKLKDTFNSFNFEALQSS